jgi:hypothetical protein
MNKISFGTSLLLAPLAYVFHHYEEHMVFDFGFRAWRLLYFPNNNPLSTERVFLIMTGIILTYILLNQTLKSKAAAHSILLLLMAIQVQNVVFHAGGTLYFWHFSPGLVTSILLYLPVNAFIAHKAFQENLLNWRSLGTLFVLGGILFWAFEILGPAAMTTTIVATYLWIGFDQFKNRGVASA